MARSRPELDRDTHRHCEVLSLSKDRVCKKTIQPFGQWLAVVSPDRSSGGVATSLVIAPAFFGASVPNQRPSTE
jgi:hypothetical protein